MKMNKPPLPGQPCQTKPLEHWSLPEKWVWQQVCEGNPADFNDLYGELDPSETSGWSDKRVISAEFLEAILLEEPFKSAVPNKGVRIIGVWVKDGINLEHAQLTRQLWLDNSIFNGNVKLDFLHSSALLSLEGSVFSKELSMISASVSGFINLNNSKVKGPLNMWNTVSESGLLMGRGAEFSNVDLKFAKIRGHIYMDRIKVTESIGMYGIEVENLYLREKAKLTNLTLDFAKVGGQIDIADALLTNVKFDSVKVGGQIDMSHVKFSGLLELTNLDVSGRISSDSSEFKKILIERTNIVRGVYINNAKVSGTLNMHSVQVGENLTMTNSVFEQPVKIEYSNIANILDFSGSEIENVDLIGTSIEGELRLPIWKGSSFLSLYNAFVHAIPEIGTKSEWPKKLILSGFRYNFLGTPKYSGADDSSIITINKKCLLDWLQRDRTYFRRSYNQLADVLQSMGRSELANAILFASKERERKLSTGLKWWGLSILKWVIGYGYGYRYFYVLPWVALITVIGAWAYSTVPSDTPISALDLFSFSFDLLLPLVELDGDKHKIIFDGFQRYYFYLHKLLGYILGFFVVAGLSGITKK